MSFHELKEFTEILRSLGFPRLVSNENFRFPNFPLMAEILEWTVKKFEPNIRLPKQLDSEQERVLFVKSVVLSLLQKAHVKLNPKNVYQSDGHAVREILPILKMLYKSLKTHNLLKSENNVGINKEESTQINFLRSQVNLKRQELRQTVSTAGELPKIGANLYQLLRDEGFSKEMRNKALGQSLNTSKIENEIKEKISDAEFKINEFKKRLENITNDEAELTKKIERRKRELEQLQKRLAKLQSFRPPYMDEYENLEKELKDRYNVYVTLFRNLHYLKQQLNNAKQAEREQAVNAEKNMRVAVERMRIESEQSALEIAGIKSDSGNFKSFDGENTSRSNEIRVFGNMTGAGLSDDEEAEEDEEDQQNQLIEVEDMEDEEEIDGEEEGEYLKENEEEEEDEHEDDLDNLGF